MQEHGPMREYQVGEVTHYWNHLGVAGVHLTAPVDVGEHVHILGHTSDIEQAIGQMEIDHHRVTHAEAGSDIGIRVAEPVREHDKVFRLVEGDLPGEGLSDL